MKSNQVITHIRQHPGRSEPEWAKNLQPFVPGTLAELVSRLNVYSEKLHTGCIVVHLEWWREQASEFNHLTDYKVSSVCSGPSLWMVPVLNP